MFFLLGFGDYFWIGSRSGPRENSYIRDAYTLPMSIQTISKIETEPNAEVIWSGMDHSSFEISRGRYFQGAAPAFA